jgi:hypothetical protein
MYVEQVRWSLRMQICSMKIASHSPAYAAGTNARQVKVKEPAKEPATCAADTALTLTARKRTILDGFRCDATLLATCVEHCSRLLRAMIAAQDETGGYQNVFGGLRWTVRSTGSVSCFYHNASCTPLPVVLPMRPWASLVRMDGTTGVKPLPAFQQQACSATPLVL